MKFGGSWSVFQPGKSMFCYGKDLGEREAKKKKKVIWICSYGYAHSKPKTNLDPDT